MRSHRRSAGCTFVFGRKRLLLGAREPNVDAKTTQPDQDGTRRARAACSVALKH